MFYFDYYSHINLMKRVKQPFSGANHGTELLLKDIMDSSYYGRELISIIYPNGFTPTDKLEETFIQAVGFKSVYVNQLEDVQFAEGDVLFIPLVCGKEMVEVNRLKRKYPFLKIYGRIHDKNHNIPLDLYDRFYYSGFKRTGLPLIFDWIAKRVVFTLKFGKWMSCFEKVFTVSNYSLQMLKNKHIKFINYYYQGVLDCYDNQNKTSQYSENSKKQFVLFVNGGRAEKNSLRSVLAFERFKRKNVSSDIKLYITSTNKRTQLNLLKKLSKYKEFNAEDIVFMDYLSREELSALYKECRFLLFMSKGEGFGLPVLEAMMAGRPSLASWNTSIPEVAASSVRYVNPFDIDSIEKGIEYYDNDEHLRKYEEAIQRRIPIVKAQIYEDSRMMIKEIFEE